MAEEIRFPIVGEDRGATRVLRDVARESAVTAAQTRVLAEAQKKEERAAFDAAAANRVLAESLEKQGRARQASVAATLASARADKILADSTDKAIAETVKQRIEQDNAGKSAIGLKSRIEAMAGSGGLAGGGMGAAVAAGVALSGQIITVGTGLGGLALAAAGVVKPIEKAAQASGGLAANLGKLDPEQQKLAKSLLALQGQYHDFQQALQPQVLAVFNSGIRIAGHLMKDVQPVAAATGKALNQVLGSIDKEFQSGNWQQFFTWMAQQAGPDTRQLGQAFTDLMEVIPQLTQDLHPLGSALITLTDDFAKATKGALDFYDSFQQNVPISNRNVGNFLKETDRWVVNLTNHIPGAQAVNDWITSFQHWMGFAGTASEKTATAVGHVTHAAGGMISPMNALGKVVPNLASALGAVAANGRPVVTNFDQQIGRLSRLVTGYKNALTAEGNYISSQITEADSLHTLNQDLKLSHDRIGLKTQAQRNSYRDALQYITNTLDEADAAKKSGKGIDGSITSIHNALPALERVKGKTQEYRDELRRLKSMLDTLRREKLITEVVHVSGQGTWRFGAAPGGAVAGPGGRFRQAGSAGGFAAGGLVAAGTTGTADDVIARVSKGELIIPARMVAAGVVDHLRGALPGFATGGIVPFYHGGPGGLTPWTSRNQAATITAIGVSIAKAMASAFKSAMASMGGGFGVAGPGGGAPAANAALARRMMPAWGSGAQWAAWNYVAMRESGWSQFARNPSSGAYGIPQALPASKMGPAANPPASNPAAQISWMIGYIRSRYGDPVGAASHERSAGWYRRGFHGYVTSPTVFGAGEAGTERVDITPAGQGRPLVHIAGNLVVQDATDAYLAAAKLSHLITAAGFGS